MTAKEGRKLTALELGLASDDILSFFWYSVVSFFSIRSSPLPLVQSSPVLGMSGDYLSVRITRVWIVNTDPILQSIWV
jgi:hypothetical protein